jgi:hypothetical protein
MPKIDISLRSAVYFKAQCSAVKTGTRLKLNSEPCVSHLLFDRIPQLLSASGGLGIYLRNLVSALRSICLHLTCYLTYK